MRHKISEAWADINPAIETELLHANQVASVDREAHVAKRMQEPAAAPMQRKDAKELFAKMHAVVDAGGEV